MKPLTHTMDIGRNIEACFYDQSKLKKIDKLFNIVLRFLRPYWANSINYYRLGRLKRVFRKKNIICNAGINASIKRLVGDTTFAGEINKAALGTGTPTPAVGDIKLATETYRNTMASGTDSVNQVILTAFYSEGEVNGTFTEFGNFINGGAGADSGELWSHIAGFSWVKDNVTVLVVRQVYTFASV